MIVQKIQLIEYDHRIPLYIGRDTQTSVYKYYTQYNIVHNEGMLVIELEEITEEEAMALTKNSSI